MGGGPAPHVHVEGSTVLHTLPAHAKLVGLVAFALVVVAVRGASVLPYAVSLAALVALVALSRVPVRHVLARMVVEVPFVVFALVLPFLALGERVPVGPFSLSRPGLLAAAVLLATSTLCVLAATLFSLTTSAADAVRAASTLRLPGLMVLILSFMVRYLGVLGDELRRMRIARESRGFRARSLRAWPVVASSAGALFIRSYERGERIHVAMRSRGYTESSELVEGLTSRGRDWLLALLPAALVLLSFAGVLLAGRSGGGMAAR